MKLLFLTFNAIDDRSYGAAIRSNHLRDLLAEIGELHTLIIHGSNQWRLDADWDGDRVRHGFYSRSGASFSAWRQRARVRAWVSDIIREGDYDAVVARYLGLAFFVPRWAWPRLVIDADDIVKSLPATQSSNVGQRLRRWIRNALAVGAVRRAGYVWCVNPLDAQRVDAKRVSIMRNVVRLPDPERPRARAIPGRILMVGLFSHPPNAEGLRWFVREVLPALRCEVGNVELHAIGKCPPALVDELSGPRVVVRGYVADLQAEYDLASLVIAPIESGGGTQIKVIDALAHERPLVTSTFAHAGFANELLPDQHLLVCADKAAWIAACNRLLGDADAAEAMAARGREGAALFGPDRLRSTMVETFEAVARQTSLRRTA